ncbi:vWA domain-containing protein [Anaeroselena agilis]|uniref:VWA domain-containing protein n=1 Tax=Anaeroselena agilis TaxID=3063788 RepID=A0ABU3NXQ3_9FIRM|nr:VWA domain-containing protein [Selenomonadales bacterium 4137-cl]
MSEAKLDYNAGFFTELDGPAALLQTLFRDNKGARIGQSTVASRKMHTVDAAKPETVTILTNVDAGKAFYNRQNADEVFHLDVFHQCGRVDHRQVASRLRQAIEVYGFHSHIYASHHLGFKAGSYAVSADLVDVQTGTGGGRITGSLSYGQKLSLRRAHENHVHITAMLPGDHAASLFYLVLAAEDAIRAAGLELRRNERIVYGRGGGNGDLSPYCDQSDSFLRQKGGAASAAAQRHQYLQDATDLIEEFDTVQDVRDILEEADGGAGEQKLLQSLARRGSGEQALRRLEHQGIVTVEGGKVRLTEYGKGFKVYLDRHLPEIEAYLRRAFRLFRPPAWRPGRSKLLAEGQGGIGPRQLKMRDGSAPAGELAVAETVNAAARRSVETVGGGLEISAEDLREFVRKRRQKAELCLVVDASASMTGQRLRAAKFLARHLLLSTPDRLSIIAFQEDSAKLVLPLTRDWQLVENSLRGIRSYGSTPLAGALTACLAYLHDANVRNPLIILITDGIPTVADHSRDPLADSLEAAAAIRQSGYGFACIGLKPHRSFLAQLAERAGGSLYVMEELEKHAMVNAAWCERAGRVL